MKQQVCISFITIVLSLVLTSSSEGYDIYKYVFTGSKTLCAAIKDTVIENGKEKEFYYLGTWFNGSIISAIKDEKVAHNYQTDCTNPLLGKKVRFLETPNNKPLVVFEDEPDRLYYLVDLATQEIPAIIISSEKFTVKQGNAAVAGEIIACERSTFELYRGFNKEFEHWIFLAVKPRAGAWGDEGSGIFVVKIAFDEVAKDRLFFQSEDVDEQDDDSKRTSDKEKQLKLRKFYFQTTDCLNYKDLAACANMQDGKKFDFSHMYWDVNFERLYLGLSFNQQSMHADQSIVLLASLQEGKLSCSSLLKTADCAHFLPACDLNHAYRLSIDDIQIMHTSTGLPYLMILAQYNEQYHILTFPLVNHAYLAGRALKDDLQHGSIATIHQNPQKHFFPDGGRFRGKTLHEILPSRSFDQLPVYSVHINTPFKKIQNIWPIKDSLYVKHADDNGKILGVHYAQAIFNEQGYLVGWSAFSPVTGSRSNIIDFLVSHDDMIYIYLEKNQQGNLSIRDTTWTSYSPKRNQEAKKHQNFIMMQQQFPIDQEGIQGLWYFDLPRANGLINKPLLVAGGKRKAILTVLDDTKEFVILDERHVSHLNIITAAQIYSDEKQSWLLLGGIEGVSVLCDNQGNGWLHTQESIANSELFDLKNIGQQRFVKKLWVDQSYVYVLTRDTLERCDLHKVLTTKESAPQFSELARASAFPGKFTDMVIFGSYIFLATTRGMFYKQLDEPEWQKLFFDPYIPRVHSLQLVPSQDNTQAQLFIMVLQDDASAYIFRFHIDALSQSIKQLVEYSYRDQPMAYVSFGGSRTRFVTDGAVWMSSRGGRFPLVHIMPVFISGKQTPSSKGYLVNMPWTGNNTVTGLVKNASSGSWIACGDFGISVLE